MKPVQQGPHWFAGCGMLVAGGFCYRMLVDESCIARESQNAPAPARASDRLLSIWSRLLGARGVYGDQRARVLPVSVSVDCRLSGRRGVSREAACPMMSRRVMKSRPAARHHGQCLPRGVIGCGRRDFRR